MVAGIIGRSQKGSYYAPQNVDGLQRVSRDDTGRFNKRSSDNLDPSPLPSWEQWQSEIVTLLQKDFGGGVLRNIGIDDVDWPSWHGFYLQGKTARAAIERALECDL